MSKKMSQEEKEANKIATNARNRAFHARHRAYHAELDAAEVAAKASQAGLSAAKASEELEKCCKARLDKINELRSEIDRITKLIAEVDAEESAKIEQARLHRNLCQSEYASALNAARKEINQRYPDMVEARSPAGWKPLEDFMQG